MPDDFDALLKLPDVGRKSANLIMGDVFGKPAIVTDTHCIRLVNRMGLVDGIKEPKKVEMELWKLVPPEEGSDFCHRLVWHGREVAQPAQNLTATVAAWRISVPKSVYKKKNKNFCKCQEKILDSKAPFVYDSQGDVMESIVKQSLLYDFYGELLTEHQRSIYEDVVYNDMSLSEIAEENGISRQGCSRPHQAL